jgi:hypothetical protein
MFGQQLQQLYSLIERVRTASILAPLLALTFMVGLFASLMSLGSNSSVINGLWSLFAFCVIVTILAYGWWSKKDPDRLQTEDYLLARLRRGVIGDERNPNDPKVIEAAPTPNPHVPMSHAEATK